MGYFKRAGCNYPVIGLFLVLIILTTACSPRLFPSEIRFQPYDWSYTDLRFLDAADAEQPSQDLLAIYVASAVDTLYLRFDMLDIPAQSDYDLYVAIDRGPGGNKNLQGGFSSDVEWDILIYLPAVGNIEIYDESLKPLPNLPVVAIRNPELDTVEISIPQSKLPGSNPNPRFQVFSTPAGHAIVADSLPPVSLHGTPPSKAPVLLAFWNSLPAYTPVQAVRRWAGAHTGPLGGRHGLRYLLKAAQDYQAPLVLLDLKALPSLPALDYLGATDPVITMARQGLLILPDVSPFSLIGASDSRSAWGIERAVQLSRETATNFKLPASQFLYAVSPEGLPDGYRFAFIPESTPGLHSSIKRFADYSLLTIHQQNTGLQAGVDGPSLEIRRALAGFALPTSSAPESYEKSILVLGGDLTASTWGDPQHASATLKYIRAHPWIELLDEQDLIAARPSLPYQPTSSPPDPFPIQQAVLEELYKAESIATDLSKPIIDNAWHAFLALNAPLSPTPPGLSALRRVYLGQVAALLSAARWAEDPTPRSDCTSDVDLDGMPECVLSSYDAYLLFEIDNGSLVYAFSRDSQGVHQWAAPSSQFIVGQSDPASWRMDSGVSADPAVIPGAFIDSGPFTPLIETGKIIFRSPDLEKTYMLKPNGLDIEYFSPPKTPLTLPLAVDPWLRFSPGWGDFYEQEMITGQWTWGVPGHFEVQLNTAVSLTAQPFNASHGLILKPENPNLDYPTGLHLPFPQAILEFNNPGAFKVAITWHP